VGDESLVQQQKAFLKPENLDPAHLIATPTTLAEPMTSIAQIKKRYASDQALKDRKDAVKY
jgi:hypothetical protein